MNPTTETLGKLAYEAYCSTRGWKSVRGEPLPHWEQQDQPLRDAWCAAARAIERKIALDTGRG